MIERGALAIAGGMGIVEPDDTLPTGVVQRQRIAQPVWPSLVRFDASHRKLDPVAGPLVDEEA